MTHLNYQDLITCEFFESGVGSKLRLEVLRLGVNMS